MLFLKQSTAVVVHFGPFVDKTDGVTLESGLVSALDHGTTGIKLSKNGGAKAVRNGTPTASVYDGGDYRVTLNTTDTNTLGTLRLLYADAATCLPVFMDCMVMASNQYDSLFGSDRLQVHVDEMTAGIITAAVIATNAIDADAIAADAGAELADAIWEEVLSGHTTPGTAGYQLDDLSFVTPPTVAAIADGVWDEAMAGHIAAGSAGEALNYAMSFPDLTDMAAAVWDVAALDYTGPTSMGGLLNAASAGASPADIADAVWDEALSGHLTAGSAGKALDDAKDGDYIGGSSAAAMGKAYQSIIAGQFVTGTLTATSASTNLTGYGNDTFNGRTLTVISGALTGEQTTISDHVETNGVLTFVELTGAPANGDEFVIA